MVLVRCLRVGLSYDTIDILQDGKNIVHTPKGRIKKNYKNKTKHL